MEGKTEGRGKENILVIATTSFPEPRAELRSPPSPFTSRNLEVDWHLWFILLAGLPALVENLLLLFLD